MPEPVARVQRPRVRTQWPFVPPEFRAPFALPAMGVVSVWIVAGRSIRSVATAAPLRHRAGAMAALWLVGYLALAAPAVLAGVTASGLGIEHAFRLFGMGIIVVALVAAAGTLGRDAARADGRVCTEGVS